MGAEFFEVVVKAKSPEAAFVSAQRQAFYDYGHAGYTGTIAEKPGFIYFGQVNMRANDYLDAYEKVQSCVCDPVVEYTEEEKKRLEELRAQFETWLPTEIFNFNSPKAKKNGMISDKIHKIEDKARERAKAKALAKLPPELAKLVPPRMVDVADSKWDEAACVLTDDGYLFFGWASC